MVPQKIVDSLLMLGDAEFGFFYRLFDNYINTGEMPDQSGFNGHQLAIFKLCMAILDPILKRRRREREARRKAQCERTAYETTNNDYDDNFESDTDADDGGSVQGVPKEHIRRMTGIVRQLMKVLPARYNRDQKIRNELERLYPGLYRDITYTPDGKVTLIV